MPSLHESALIRHLFIAPLAIFAIGCDPPSDAGATTAQGAQAPPGRSCTVTRISDGDSFECGTAGRVRLLMIDAPELAQGDAGRRSRNALEQLAPKGTVLRLETDVRPTDDYNRTLAYAYLPDGRMVNEEMARAGMVAALVYPPNVRYERRIRDAAREAREGKRGFWAREFFECLPRDYRAGRCGGGAPRRRR